MSEPTGRERKLTDILFQIAYMIHTNEALKQMSSSQVMEWAAEQLNDCGFYNIPMGASWGYLVSKESLEKYRADAA